MKRKTQIGPPPREMGEFLNSEEAASYLRRPRLTVEKWAREGKFPAYKTGKRYLFKLDELRKWVESRATRRKASEGEMGQVEA